ncbi:hypothetical protein B0T10DRAFT_561452 [Thelonectria olida]|uniref:Uncharacterized protein n=1 Tax=Thelonectria olida TaxID=1576542 RepID=A0A9P8W854_9HYPO|nr:hypothetical protein B0T10DRAFT_561452 [Thelonectria olida]
MGSSMTEMWLQDPYATYLAEASGEFCDLSQVPLPDLSRNFEVLFNTFWQSTFGARYLSRNLSTYMSLYDDIVRKNSQAVEPVYPIIDVDTSHAIATSQEGKQYASSGVFMSMTLTPDVLVMCLRVLERARAIKDVQVTIGDVTTGDGKTGQVAFAVTGRVQQFQRDRLYD